jgi:hypothetical protein
MLSRRSSPRLAARDKSRATILKPMSPLSIEPAEKTGSFVTTVVNYDDADFSEEDVAVAVACMHAPSVTTRLGAARELAYTRGRHRVMMSVAGRHRAPARSTVIVAGVLYVRSVVCLTRSVLKIVCADTTQNPACPGGACAGRGCEAHHELSLLRKLGPNGPICVPIAWHAFPSGSAVLFPRAATDLEQHMSDGGEVDRPLVRRVTHGLLDALKHLHDRDIVHGDVKRENVLLWPDQRVQLCDLDLADDVGPLRRALESGDPMPDRDYWAARCRAGSRGSLDPYCLAFVTHVPMVDPLVTMHVFRERDYWGLTVLLFCLFTSRHPYGYDGAEMIVQSATDLNAALALAESAVDQMRSNFDYFVDLLNLDSDDAHATAQLIFPALRTPVLAGETRRTPMLRAAKNY